MKDVFRAISNKVSGAAGSPYTFLLAFLIVVIWATSGPMFNFSNTWQLVINTGTTIVTFLMVFLIQNTQNRDGKAVQLKLDELIRATKARDSFVDHEDLSDNELAAINDEFIKLHNSQSTIPALHKLHSKLEAEHKRRLSIRQHAGNVFNTLLKPLDKK